MELFECCKLQFGLLLIMFYISYLFTRDGNRLNKNSEIKHCNHYFDCLFVLAEIALLFDGLTSYTVNHMMQIPTSLNMIAHLIYLLNYQLFIFVHFLYWLSVTDSLPQRWNTKLFCYLPIALSSILTILFIPKIGYHLGHYTNYATGLSVIICFTTIGIYSIFTLLVFILKKNYIQNNKRTGFVMALTAACCITLLQMIFHEMLVSSIAVVLMIISIYLCMENPTIKYLEYYHDEMVTGFATLVESKDGSTGGHIRRSSAYAVLIAKLLRKDSKYKKILTKDYIDTLKKQPLCMM